MNKNIEEHVFMPQLTTMKIGGRALYYTAVQTIEQLSEVVQFARDRDIPLKVLGGGSNLVLPDSEFEGVLVSLQFTGKEVLGQSEVQAYPSFSPQGSTRARYSKEAGFLNLVDPTAAPSNQSEMAYAQIGAGVPWGQAVIWTLDTVAAGFHRYARIPCTVGGAIYNNIHGEKHFLEEHIAWVEVFNTKTGEVEVIPAQDLGFGYDASIFHSNKQLIILSGIFHFTEQSPEARRQAKLQYLEWTKAKVIAQPAGNNCGSVFQNLDEHDLVHSGDSQAAAWYIDQTGLKGERIGDLEVSMRHANFIQNLGNGTQADFIALLVKIRSEVFKKFSVMLTPEVEIVNQYGSSAVWPKNVAEPEWGVPCRV